MVNFMAELIFESDDAKMYMELGNCPECEEKGTCRMFFDDVDMKDKSFLGCECDNCGWSC
jgi:hypothetical protein